MFIIFTIFWLVCLVALIIGLISPKTVIKWGTKKTRGQAALIYGISMVIFFILAGVTASPTEEQPEPPEVTSSPPVEQKEEPAPPEIEEKKVAPTKEEKPKAEPKEGWYKVISWKGVSTKKTEPFEIKGKQWRIKWSFTATDPQWGVIAIAVYSPDPELKYFAESVTHRGDSHSDVSYFYKQGTFYLDVECANGKWSIVVEELK